MNNSSIQDKTFKILSIDGGGIKGLYSATILEHFEKKFNCRISDHFDMLCGTSTGGLIALALPLKIPAQEVCNFYINEGPSIFPEFKKNKLVSKILKKNVTDGDINQVLRNGKFSDIPLKKALQKIFGTRKIGESKNLLCVPSYLITEARTWVFKRDHSNLDRDNKALYVDVALATSAAPTFFPMAEIPYYDQKQFIDGGVWANNPALVGLIEALDYFVGEGKEYNKIKLLSISSLSVSSGKPLGLKRERSFLDWKKDLFETSLTGQSLFTDYFLSKVKTLSGVGIDYIRVPSVDVSQEQADFVQLDVATSNALNLIRSKGDDQGLIYKKKTEIEEFFKELKTYNL